MLRKTQIRLVCRVVRKTKNEPSIHLKIKCKRNNSKIICTDIKCNILHNVVDRICPTILKIIRSMHTQSIRVALVA